ncbi:MAG: cytochrome c peroxidase [Pseudomonadota bacterium]
MSLRVADLRRSWFAALGLCCVGVAMLAVLALTGPSLHRTAHADGGGGAISFWREVFAPPAPLPARRQLGPARAALGHHLMSDPRALSPDGAMSCTSCHIPSLAFTDALSRARARGGKNLARNTPTLFGIAGASAFNWDGSAKTLREQALRPILSRHELAGDWQTIIGQIENDPISRRLWRAAFPDTTKPRTDHVLTALAAAISELKAPATRFDAFLNGDASALTERELIGFRLFTGRGQCVSCHMSARLTDDKFHDIGIATADVGRAGVTGRASDRHRFKTPTLRSVRVTAPYMHNGSIATLDGVVRHYERGGIRRPTRAETMPDGLSFTNAERRALVAFLRTL